MIDVYTLARIKDRYPVDDSGYSPRKYAADELFVYPHSSYSTSWAREKYILSQALTVAKSDSATLADQVFGNQARQSKLHVMHDANLITRRYELHQQSLRDVAHRMGQVQEQISIARMLSAGLLSKEQTDLQKLLFNLEAQKRDEEIAFWKDTLKLRQELFTGVGEYQSAKHRVQLLGDMEDQNA